MTSLTIHATMHLQTLQIRRSSYWRSQSMILGNPTRRRVADLEFGGEFTLPPSTGSARRTMPWVPPALAVPLVRVACDHDYTIRPAGQSSRIPGRLNPHAPTPPPATANRPARRAAGLKAVDNCPPRSMDINIFVAPAGAGAAGRAEGGGAGRRVGRPAGPPPPARRPVRCRRFLAGPARAPADPQSAAGGAPAQSRFSGPRDSEKSAKLCPPCRTGPGPRRTACPPPPPPTRAHARLRRHGLGRRVWGRAAAAPRLAPRAGGARGD
jgi:hypothetical protein